MKIRPINWNEKYIEDKEKKGIGFDITNPEGLTKDKKRTIDGIYSPLFGTELSDDISYLDRVSCKCGKLIGGYNEGIFCEECETYATYHNNDMIKTGYMSSDNFKLINPLFYFMIQKIISKKNLNNIIKYNKKKNQDGKIIVDLDEYDPENPFYSIGMVEFYERFEEILTYYKDNLKGQANTKEDKMKTYYFLLENKDKIWINKIPVYTILLRPILIISNNLIYADINKKYSGLLTNIHSLNKTKTTIDRTVSKTLPLLYQSQLLLNEIHNLTVEQISGKRGIIRNNILGLRVNFSSRCVIVPLIGRYDLDNIVLNYQCFLELYKFEIINILSKMDGITTDEANRRWNIAVESFDKKIYLIMKLIIKNTKGGLWVLINRNPSLCLGSILLMRVVDVSMDFDNLTMSVPLNVLGLLAGDFDGDVLNIISLKAKEFVNAFSIFNPRRLMIDKNNGKFNRTMGLIKDQMIGLYSFCNS